MLSIAGLLAMIACGGSSSEPSLATHDVEFGEVDVGGSAARDVTLTNTTTSPLDVTDVITSGSAGVITSGRALPFTLQPGESTRLFVEMAPTTSGDLSGTLSLVSATTEEPVTLIRTRGRVRLAEQLVASSASVDFGEVTVGASASQELTLTNSGTQHVTVTSLSASAAGVSVTGLPLPATFAPGESATFTLAFAPTVAGGVAGSIAARAESGRPASVVTVSGTGVSPAAPVTLTAAPARVDFRDVTVGSFSTQGVTLTNSSSQEVSISELVTTGSGFTASGIAPATVLAPGGSATVSVKFTPTAVGAAAGQVAVRTAGQTEPIAVVDLVGNGVAAASITSVTVRDSTIEAGKTVQLQADVVAVGTIDRSVTWSVDPASRGTIDPTSGVYTAPATAGTYQVVATSNADQSKSATATVTVTAPTSAATPPSPTPIPSGVGTGTSYQPSYVTNVTGGGSMPSWTTNVVTASCAGNGTTDDTACLQAAANNARSQNRPLAIPYTPAFYRISGAITIYTSVGGVGGMPTIKQTNTSGNATGNVFRLAAGMTGWIYNLRLVGAFTGNATGEWAHNIDVGAVNGVTIKGNVLENAMGDSIGSDALGVDGGSASNVLVDSNTLKNPRRCGIAFVLDQDRWVVMNNVIDKQVNYVSGIDFEPEGGTITNVEVAYNKFVMNNRTPGQYGSDGRAVSAWQNQWSPAPGGNLYLHHNWGTFGVGWWMTTSSYMGGMGAWYNVVQNANIEGNSVPN